MTLEQATQLTEPEINAKIAEIMLKQYCESRGMKPRQNKSHWQLAFGGGDAFGLWLIQ